MESSFDPSKRGGCDWGHTTIIYGKIKLEKPFFWTDRNDQEEEWLEPLPKHARHQHMTYYRKGAGACNREE